MRLIDPIELKRSIAVSNMIGDGKTLEELIDEQPDAQPQASMLTVECKFDDEELAKAIEEFKKANLELIATEPRWIPVTERLPENGKDVLVTRKYDGREDGHKSCCYVEVASCFKQDDGVTWNSYSDEYKMHPRNHSVIAWIPLPQAWKEV